MRTIQKAKLLRLHFSEADQYKGKPLYEAIVNRCHELKIAGATVFRGLEGYGQTAEIHRHHAIKKDQPIVVTIVDTEDNLSRLLPEVEEMMDTGMIATSEVEFIRIQKTPAGTEDAGRYGQCARMRPQTAMTNRAFHDAIYREENIPVEMVRLAVSGQKVTRDYRTSWKFYGALS
jgi:PII-like signaling protein